MPLKSAALRSSRVAKPPLHLEISAAVGKDLVPFLRKHLRAAHAELRPALVELSLALVGDKAMADLHQQFMGIAGPTDVLTFPLDEDARGRVTAGEVVVCIPEARRRAKAEGTELRHEALLYALHGMLHLCGYDDLTPADFKRMHRTEDRILAAIGVGAVFERTSKSGRPESMQSASIARTLRAKAKRRSANARETKGVSRANDAR